MWAPAVLPKAAQGKYPFSAVFILDLVLGCGTEWAGAEYWGGKNWDFASTWDQPGLTLWQTFPRTSLLQIWLQTAVQGWWSWSASTEKQTTVYSSPGPVHGDLHFCGTTRYVLQQSPPQLDPFSHASAVTGLKARRTPAMPLLMNSSVRLGPPQTLWALSTQLYQVLSQGSTTQDLMSSPCKY